MSTRMVLQDFDEGKAALASESIEGPLCAYLNEFDGTSKDFSELRPHLNGLFSDDLIYCVDGKPIDRQTFTSLNKYLLEHHMIATPEDIYFADDTHIEYTVHWANDDVSMVTHVLGLVDSGKIIKIESCPETSSAFANIFLRLDGKKAIVDGLDKKIMKIKEWALTQRASRAA